MASAMLPGTEINKIEFVAAGPMTVPAAAPNAPPNLLPEHCFLRGTLNLRKGTGGRSFGIGFELRMPTQWNRRFLFQGGGGLDGVVNPAVGTLPNSSGPVALARGFAVVSTDAGHGGSPVDASFALDQQARIDYSYNALDKVTLEAKRLIARYYGAAPAHSYFVGCSNGGRQAMTAAQKLPLYFDGIVAGDPTIGFSRVAIDEVWNVQQVAKIAPKDAEGRPILAKAFSDADLALVKTALLKRCDAKDGLKDGMINDWQRCDFNPVVLMCKARKTAACLSKGQVSVLRALHDGPRTPAGQSIYGPFNYDTGIASSSWRGMRLGTSQTGASNAADATLGVGQFKYLQLTPPEPGFDPLAPLDYGKVLERVRATAAMADADSPYLETFAGRGKLIAYNGLSDQGLASSELVRWYQKMLAATGSAGRENVRLYLVPGMLHCGGGEATDQFEMLDAVVGWVEDGKTPDRILATNRQRPGLSRPLCPFPSVARYKAGKEEDAGSFRCEP
ncbi:MAG: tannase/feruloyl esterase family alpha/beta hydrolase [Sphingobium sp.]|nr:tannase/feruloyl esterase family alpha/beta hydrolase [Sphingobium sp.]